MVTAPTPAINATAAIVAVTAGTRRGRLAMNVISSARHKAVVWAVWLEGKLALATASR